MELEGLLTEDL